jgi:hypothetical protein
MRPGARLQSPERPAMTLVVTAAACLVAEVLLLSAAYKAFRPANYLDAVRSYRLLRSVNPALRSALALALPIAELASGALILAPATRLTGLAAAFAVLLVFHVVVGGDDRPVIASCGCWGRTSFGVSRRVLLARNLALTGVTAAAFAGTAVSTPTGHSPVLETLLAAGMVLPLAFLVLETPELHMLATLRPGDRDLEPRR